MDKETAIVGALGTIGSVLSYFFGAKAKAKKDNAEADKMHIGNVDKAVEIWEGLVHKLESEMEKLKNEVRDWEKRFSLQEAKIVELQKENLELHQELNILRLQMK